MGLNNKLLFENYIGHQKPKKVLNNAIWEYNSILYKKKTKALNTTIHSHYTDFNYAVIDHGVDFTFLFKRYNNTQYKKVCNRYPFMFSKVFNFFKYKRDLIIPILLVLFTFEFLIPSIPIIIFGLLIYLPFEYIIHNFIYGRIINTVKRIRYRELKNFIKHSMEIENWIKIKSTYLNSV